MKIGIFGGTFNPPHLGHLAAAEAAIAALGLDKLYIVPASNPPHKELPENTPSPEHRLAMAEIMADALLMPQVTEHCPYKISAPLRPEAGKKRVCAAIKI